MRKVTWLSFIMILLVLSVRGQDVVDSYAESNVTGYSPIRTGASLYVGQGFAITDSKTITSAKFYLLKQGSPTGTGYAQIYAHTGTWGTDGKPTGSALATSEGYNIASLTTSGQLITFTFSTQYTCSASTYYYIVFYFESSSSDASNYVRVGYDGTTPTHGSNIATSTNGSVWTANVGYDYAFYVYGTTPAVTGTNEMQLLY